MQKKKHLLTVIYPLYGKDRLMRFLS